MKKGVVFLLGFFAGIVFTFVVTMIVTKVSNANDNGITMFEQPGKKVSGENFVVLQVVDDNYALAYDYRGLVVLVMNDNGEYYYDNQTIYVPNGKCMRQVGVYKYQTKTEDWKTVPIVKIMDLP
jgi:hypothetical protein